MLLAQIVHIFQDITVDIAKAETEEIIAQRSGIGRRSQAVEVVQSDESIALTRDTVVKFDLGAVQVGDLTLDGLDGVRSRAMISPSLSAKPFMASSQVICV